MRTGSYAPVNSSSTHINEVRILLEDKFLDVLAIQETKVDGSNRDFEFTFPVLIELDVSRISDVGGGV